LIQEIWQTDFTDDMRVLHVHIRMLRKKIEDDPNVPQLIQTVRNRGYRFVVPDVERIF
jgi:two-component system alkaline phosphatase synthesis response regulator PhoP